LKIAQTLGGLPLAISQMAGIIRYQYLSFSEFLERYEDEMDRKELFEMEAGTSLQVARGNLASIWAVEILEPQARALLEVCSLLDPDCIQERIFLDGASSVTLEHYPQKKLHFTIARADLLKRSLVRRSLGEKEYWIHRVLQDSIKAKMAVERRREVFSAAVALTISAWGNTPLLKRYDTSLSKSREGLFPHIMSLAKVYETVCRDAKATTNIDLANLLHEAGWYASSFSPISLQVANIDLRWQNERGNSHDNKFLFELALKICKEYPGKDTYQLLGDIHYGLSAVANETNNGDECFKHTSILLRMRLQATQESGVSDLRLAVAHNQMGMSWVMAGEQDTAIAAFKSSIQIYQGLDDYWASMDTNPRMNMGFTYWLKGDLETASTVFEELLRDRIAKFGTNDKESYR
jgi:tetratricopeptide (TPR) repeat protein